MFYFLSFRSNGYYWRDNYVPDVSASEQDVIEVDSETKDVLKMMDFQNIPGLQLAAGANFLT